MRITGRPRDREQPGIWAEIIKLWINAPQNGLSLAEQRPSYQPQTFKMSAQFIGNHSQLRGINSTKCRKLNQRQETPVLVGELSRAQNYKSFDNIAGTPGVRSRNPPYTLMPPLMVRSTFLSHTKRLLGAGYYHLQPRPQ